MSVETTTKNISFHLCCFYALHPGVNPFENKYFARLSKFFLSELAIGVVRFSEKSYIKFQPDFGPVNFHYSSGIV